MLFLILLLLVPKNSNNYKYNITTEGERTSRAHTGANNKDYHARKTFYVRENSLVGAGDIGPNGLCNA
jgi:hypothetical protein